MADYRFIMNHSGSGRCGTIDYHEEGRSVEVYWEGAGRPEGGIGFGYIGLKEWTDPKGAKIDREHQLKILRRLRK